MKQGCDKKTYLKLVLNKVKVIEGPTINYAFWGPNFKKSSWKLHPHVWPMTQLRVN